MIDWAGRTNPYFKASFLLVTGVVLVLLAGQMIGGGRVLIEAVGGSFTKNQHALYVLHVGMFYMLLGVLMLWEYGLDSAKQAYISVGISLTVVFVMSIGGLLLLNLLPWPNPSPSSLGYRIPERILFFMFMTPAMFGLPLGVAHRTGNDDAVSYAILLFLVLPIIGYMLGMIVLDWAPLGSLQVAAVIAVDMLAAIPLCFIGWSVPE